MDDRHDPRIDSAGLDRRRLIGTAGLVAGAAWVAPTVISATPAGAGIGSPDPCNPVVIANFYDCATGGQFSVEVPNGCPAVPLFGEISVNGAPFAPQQCGEVFGAGVAAPGNLVNTIVYRISWVTDCTARTVVQSFTSVPLGGCGTGASPDSGAVTPRIETTRDGDSITVTISES